jgi:hypothetical protein
MSRLLTMARGNSEEHDAAMICEASPIATPSNYEEYDAAMHALDAHFPSNYDDAAMHALDAHFPSNYDYAPRPRQEFKPLKILYDNNLVPKDIQELHQKMTRMRDTLNTLYKRFRYQIQTRQYCMKHGASALQTSLETSRVTLSQMNQVRDELFTMIKKENVLFVTEFMSHVEKGALLDYREEVEDEPPVGLCSCSKH